MKIKFVAEAYNDSSHGYRGDFCGVQIVAYHGDKRCYTFCNEKTEEFSPCFKIWSSFFHYKTGFNKKDAVTFEQMKVVAEREARGLNSLGIEYPNILIKRLRF